MPQKSADRRGTRPLIALAIAIANALTAAEIPQLPAPAPRDVVVHTDYQGWPDAILLGNGVVEAVIVPSIGRVMQFRFRGEPDGPFWENPALTGRKADPAAEEWVNYGGDKAWPAPQAGWLQITSRAWPPPKGFDGFPMETKIDGLAVTLISPIDADYGVRVLRRIEFPPAQPVMRITTVYEKVRGAPLEVGVWIITQLKDPLIVKAALHPSGRLETGYLPMSAEPPANLKLENGWISLTRDARTNHKIGTLSETLLWIGRAWTLRIDSPLMSGGKYPDGGSSAEIYTNAGPLAYVELEVLGPLVPMKIGDKIERPVTYTLQRRVSSSPCSP